MNALVSVDIETLTPATVFAPGGIDAIVSKIEAEVRAEAFDVTTLQGRDRIKSVAYKVARSKTALDDMGKELVADIKKQAGAIDADRRTARDRLDALKDEVRGPLTAWEQAEERRINAHAAALAFLTDSVRFSEPPSPATIRERMAAVRETCSRDWQEFQERAEVAAGDAGSALGGMLADAEQRERDAAELEALRREKAERDARDQAEAAAKAKAEAERLSAERALEAERIRQEQRAKDAEAAAARAVEQERQRVAAKKAADDAATAKREANAKHRTKIHKAIGDALRALEADIPNEGGDDLINFIVGNMIAGKIPHVSIEY